jgi:nickel-type superoxide dismutase maturation protease
MPVKKFLARRSELRTSQNGQTGEKGDPRRRSNRNAMMRITIMLKFVKISNNSLLPEYQEGDYVLIVKIPLFLESVRRGDVVVFRHPLYGMMIKKVSRVAEDGKEIYVVGTHENSVDSRQFGAVRNDALIGKVIWHIARPFRELFHSSDRGFTRRP